MKLRTSRLETHYLESGPQDGIPVVLVHGNLSTGRFAPSHQEPRLEGLLGEVLKAGGRAEIELFEGSGHFPPIDAAERWGETFFGFLASVEP